jgi:hypothetical protein
VSSAKSIGKKHKVARTTTEQTTTMKEKSTKQSKKEKAAVQIKDLKPTKDAQGQRRIIRQSGVLRSSEVGLGGLRRG